MIKLFHAPGSRSVRIIWLLEELGLNYELEVLKRGEINQAFVEASPFSKLPTITDGEVVMSESVAIVHTYCKNMEKEDWSQTMILMNMQSIFSG